MKQRELLPLAWLASGVAILIGGATLVCANGTCRALTIDLAGLALLNAWRTSGLDTFFAAITWFGSLSILLPVALLVAWRASRRSSFRASAFVPFSLLVAASMAHVVKLIVERSRPEQFPALVLMPADWSYPSAHAMQATAFVLALLIHIQPSAGQVIGAMIFVLLVGISRIYLQVHFPTDVAFGILAAICCTLAARELTVARRSIA